MDKKILLTQSMYFPWIGMLEQIKLCDVFIHHDNIILSKRGFYSRVQIKTDNGTKWLSIPLQNYHSNIKIDEAMIDNQSNWKKKHYDLFLNYYSKAPYKNEAISIIEEVFDCNSNYLVDITRSSMLALSNYFGLLQNKTVLDASMMNAQYSSSKRVLDLILKANGNIYITGHGAKNYLDHELLDINGIETRYMRYDIEPYSQLYGTFTPFVSGLDLVANCGKNGLNYIHPKTLNWRKFINECS